MRAWLLCICAEGLITLSLMFRFAVSGRSASSRLSRSSGRSIGLLLVTLTVNDVQVLSIQILDQRLHLRNFLALRRDDSIDQFPHQWIGDLCTLAGQNGDEW